MYNVFFDPLAMSQGQERAKQVRENAPKTEEGKQQIVLAPNFRILVSFDSAPDADCKKIKIMRRSTIHKELCIYIHPFNSDISPNSIFLRLKSIFLLFSHFYSDVFVVYHAKLSINQFLPLDRSQK